MKNTNIYKIGLIVMLVANGVLIFLLVHRPGRLSQPGTGKAGLMHKISQQLELSKEQEENYFALAKAHRRKMVELESSQRELIKSYFDFLKEPGTAPERTTPILEQLKSLEAKKLTITYHHFEELKALCNQEQQGRFGLIIDEIIKVLVNEEKKLPPPPRDF